MAKSKDEYVHYKIHKLIAEGKTHDQAVGQALGMAREKGYSVPKPKKKGSKTR